ncbi:glycosyltransferase family 39 protein [Dyadobacter sp. CY326]|uniref:ArnT family glycosyltransferase n=1 Tax=Dyadobacter sp. CY326 TaxID=2907300 RepID=UPI001F242435|nr:glycosyltransferase family 39 protein [Dyadobacter sp. CY326]MCE7065076.1 glycosyltransferase family 39 protein [Dyadobacter sp. CY326]
MSSTKDRFLHSPKENIKNLGWLLTVCFIGMTFIPRSLDHVLFMDGLAYAAISRNMAFGQGTFWEPHFADSFWLPFNHCSFFCEHPPWMFGLESLLFRIMGDTTAVENVYNAIILIASMWLIYSIWQKLFEHNSQIKDQAWLPILLWYGLRIVWWSVPNNLLDTTMAVFCLCSCYLQLIAISGDKFRPGYWLLAGIMIFFACMTKGPVGIFPLAFPAIYFLVYGKSFFKTAVYGTLIVSAAFIVSMFLILQYPPANYFLNNYFEGQVMAALLKKREKVGNDWTAHFHLLRLLIINVVPHIMLFLGLIAGNLYLKVGPNMTTQTKKASLLAFLLTTSVVLPMLASVKQGDHYLLPALPFVGLFFAACTVELLLPITLKFSAATRLSFVVLSMIAVSLMTYRLVYPETDRMFDISKRLSEHVPPNSKIYLPDRISSYPEIHTTFQRYSRLSIAYNPKETKYLFFEEFDNSMLDSIKRTNAYQIIDLGLSATLAIHKK